MTDRTGARWYTIAEVAATVGRSRVTVRRALRPYRVHCRLTRERRHPRRLVVMPERVATALQDLLR